jgi:hypothetical protein
MGWKSLLKREPLLGGFWTSIGSSLSSVWSQSSSYLHLFLVGGTLMRRKSIVAGGGSCVGADTGIDAAPFSSSSSPILAKAFSGCDITEVADCDHSALMPASKKAEHCARIKRCSRYFFSCPSALITISTSPVCEKKGNSF